MAWVPKCATSLLKPRPAQGRSRFVVSAVLVKLAVFHDRQDVFALAQQARNVGQRVAPDQQQIVIFALGFITSSAGQVLSFFFGSSQGSKDKSEEAKLKGLLK